MREKSDYERNKRGIFISNLERPAVAVIGRCPAARDGVRCPADLFSLPWGLVRVVVSTIDRRCLAVQKKAPSDYPVSVPEPSGICHRFKRLTRLAVRIIR